MIDFALKCVADDLDARLSRERHDTRRRVVVSNIVDQSGSPPLETADVLVLALIALDEEKNLMDGGAAVRGLGGYTHTNDPIFLNLHVMLAATHRRYETALAALSAGIGCLQAKPVFDHRNTPRLPEAIRQLNVNMEKLSYAEQSNIWGYLGAKYIPAALYKVRLVAVGSQQVDAWLPAIEGVEVGP